MHHFKWDKYHLLVKIIAIALVIAIITGLGFFLRRSLFTMASERDIAVSQRDVAVFQQEVAVSQRDELQKQFDTANSERENLQVELDNAVMESAMLRADELERENLQAKLDDTTAERDALQSKVSSIDSLSAREKWEEAVTAWEAVEASMNAWREALEMSVIPNVDDVDPWNPVTINNWTENMKDWLIDLSSITDARDRTFELLEVAWETTAVAWDVSALLWDIEDNAIAAIVAKSAALQANKAAVARRNARLATTDWISSYTLDQNVRIDILNAISRILIENQDLESRVTKLEVANDMLDVVEQSTDKIVSTKMAIFDTAGTTAWKTAGDTAAYFAQTSDSLSDVYEGSHWQTVKDIWMAVADSYQLVAEENTGAVEARLSIVNAIKETRDAYDATFGLKKSEAGA